METKQLTNQKIANVWNTIEQIGKLEYNSNMYEDEKISRSSWQKFAYAIARNSDLFEPIFKAIQKVAEPSKEYKEYDVKRFELSQKFADLDSAGQPVVKNNSYVVTKKLEEFQKEIVALRLEYKKVIEDYDNINTTLNELLDKEEEIKYYKIDSKWIPLTLTSQQLKALLPIVEGEF